MAAEHEVSPKSLRVMETLRWLLLALAASLAAFSWWSIASADPSVQNAPRYYCPMHPAVTSHDPGECPICHMTLEPIPEPVSYTHLTLPTTERV